MCNKTNTITIKDIKSASKTHCFTTNLLVNSNPPKSIKNLNTFNKFEETKKVAQRIIFG